MAIVTHWQIEVDQTDLVFGVSDELYVPAAMEGKKETLYYPPDEETLYNPSDEDSRKFRDGKPMKIRRLDWDSCLCHFVESSLHQTHF